MQAILNSLLQAFKSKTVWFGLLLAVATWFQGTINGGGLDSNTLAIVGPIVGAVVVWLRSVTAVPLSQK